MDIVLVEYKIRYDILHCPLGMANMLSMCAFSVFLWLVTLHLLQKI